MIDLNALERLTQEELRNRYQKGKSIMYAVDNDLVINGMQIRETQLGEYKIKWKGVLYTFLNKSAAATFALLNGTNQSLIRNLDDKLARAKDDKAAFKSRIKTTTSSFKINLYEIRHENAARTINSILNQFELMTSSCF